MAMARLHLICGNCGCNDEWKWEVMPKELTDTAEEDIYLWCGNCSTLHSLSDNAEPKSPTSTRIER